MKHKSECIATLAAIALAVTGCSAGGPSQDLGNPHIYRRIALVNGITNEYMLTIEGSCSVNVTHLETPKTQVKVTCDAGDGQYKEHELGLSDNVTYVVEQLDGDDHPYKVVYRPEPLE